MTLRRGPATKLPAMSLNDLVVLHRRGGPLEAPAADEALFIGTCLRSLMVGTRPLTASAVEGTELYTGAEAYGFLLRLSCGLESEIAGETEIFGQVKAAWREYEARASLNAHRLRPLMRQLMKDTKEIRTGHLIGLGSGSYGTLVRKLLGGRVEGPTLLIGAGQLAATVLPYLEGDVAVWNRTPANLEALLAEMRRRGVKTQAQAVAPDLESELAAWGRARNVIVCVPSDPTRDAQRATVWQSPGPRGGRLVHLGMTDVEGTPWEQLAGLFTLADLFAMRDAQADQRQTQLERARRACGDKAQALAAREAGQPASGQQGWDAMAVQVAGS